MERQRIILHVDMDAFFAAIEQRDDPSLVGRPVIVGGPGARGVVSTASYEARPFGVHSAMPMAEARRRCPEAVVRPGRLRLYAAVSAELMEELARFTPLLEPLSLDEAFLDMTGSEGLFGEPPEMARAIKDAVQARTRLSCSVGIAANKFLAKLASDLDKPDGITLVPFGREAAFIAPLPLSKLWGVGPAATTELQRLGYRTIGQIAAADLSALEGQLGGRFARHLHALACAHDDRQVVSGRRRKSVGAEMTLERDVQGRAAVEQVLGRQCRRVAQQLRRNDLLAAGLRVKIRFSRGFRTRSRQMDLPTPADDSRSLIDAAGELLDRFELDEPIRLVGAAAFKLLPAAAAGQLDLFEGKQQAARSELEHTVDRIRDRFGDKIEYGER